MPTVCAGAGADPPSGHFALRPWRCPLCCSPPHDVRVSSAAPTDETRCSRQSGCPRCVVLCRDALPAPPASVGPHYLARWVAVVPVVPLSLPRKNTLSSRNRSFPSFSSLPLLEAGCCSRWDGERTAGRVPPPSAEDKGETPAMQTGPCLCLWARWPWCVDGAAGGKPAGDRERGEACISESAHRSAGAGAAAGSNPKASENTLGKRRAR